MKKKKKRNKFMDKYQMFVLKNSEYSVWNGIPFVSNHTNKTNDPKQVPVPSPNLVSFANLVLISIYS